MTQDLHEDHDPHHMDGRETCEHGWLFWQACRECGAPACPNFPIR